MADARDRAEFNRVSWVCSHICNSLMMSEDQEPVTHWDCNPYVLIDRMRREESQKKVSSSGNIPYDPSVLQKLQEQNAQLKQTVM